MSIKCLGPADLPSLDPGDLDPEGRRRLGAWLSLQSGFGLQPQNVREALDRLRDPASVLRLLGRPALSEPRDLDRTLAVLARHRVRCVPYLCTDYPLALHVLSDPPLMLFVAGDPSLLTQPAVAIVGARAATASGLAMARETARVLAGAGIVVVSGLARGIDSAAHRGALEVGGKTLAVQACGPDRIYPAEHRRLAEQIRDRGALVTEFPLGAPPRRPHFPLRNRLISGLCRLVIVIEARQRSGSLITAQHAADQGRDVMALPGPVSAPTSWGPNRLIRDGATPLLEPADALRWLGLEPDTGVMGEGSGAREAEAGSERDPLTRQVEEILREQPLSRDALSRRLGRPPEHLSLELLDLELEGEVRESRDGCLHWISGGAQGRR